MAIYRLLLDGAFSPEEIRYLTHAYEGALRILHLDRSDPATNVLAQKIIEVAGGGETSPSRICEMAVKELGIKSND
jgi:hypothetical protein